jgi:hypothetical protein
MNPVLAGANKKNIKYNKYVLREDNMFDVVSMNQE